MDPLALMVYILCFCWLLHKVMTPEANACRECGSPGSHFPGCSRGKFDDRDGRRIPVKED